MSLDHYSDVRRVKDLGDIGGIYLVEHVRASATRAHPTQKINRARRRRRNVHAMGASRAHRNNKRGTLPRPGMRRRRRRRSS